RGYHVLFALAARALLCWGPVLEVPTRGGERAQTREQRLVRVEDWVRDAATPADPLTELFVRYIDGHGPASVRDFAWWSGLPLGMARQAAETGAARVQEMDTEGERLFAARSVPAATADAPTVVALPPF